MPPWIVGLAVAPIVENGLAVNAKGHPRYNLGNTGVIEHGLADANNNQVGNVDTGIVQCQVSDNNA